MHIERLLIENFRNIVSLQEVPHPRFNVYEGDNGQGKTNLLEAIAVLSGLRSFRTSKLGECIRFEQARAEVGGRVVGRGQRVDLGVAIEGNRARVQIDGRPPSRQSEALVVLATVVFSAADLQLAHGEPAQRRRWLDRAMFQHRPGYLAELRRFESAIANRNALLRSALRNEAARPGAGVDLDALDAFDVVLAEVGGLIRARRDGFLRGFVADFGREFSAFGATGVEASLHYLVHEPSSARSYRPATALVGAAGGSAAAETEQLVADLRARRRLDLQRGVTSVGPQRDDIAVMLSGRPAAVHASAGQSRSLAIAWRIAEIASLERALGEPPVLLLDDLSSELDAERNAALMRHLDALGGQVFLTTTDARHIKLQADARRVRVQAGRLVASGLALGEDGGASSR